MDGKELKRRLRQLLNEPSTSSFLDSQTSYDYLFEAAKQWTILSRCLRKTQTITTVAEQASYAIDGDFLGLYLKDTSHQYIIKYNDGSNIYWPTFKPYEDTIYDNNTDSTSTPGYFTLSPETTHDSLITATASADGSSTGGKCTLTTATATFSNVTPGDPVHNTTDGSDGIVITYTSTTSIDIALFDGTDNDITSGDTVLIQPRGRLQLTLDPPPSTADHTITFYMLKTPNPVYSDYDVYPFAYDYADALAKYAAWLYKFRDREPNFGHAFYTHFYREATKYATMFKESTYEKRSRITPRFRTRY